MERRAGTRRAPSEAPAPEYRLITEDSELEKLVEE
ncbi:MAG: hypothetical protein JWM85_2603, partial [Acidimicrobiaceae bacterium]|nr:hypothetical protein [Acidimicrobiaceae bacterium]